MIYCSECKGREDLGEPSAARWLGPDGKKYCSMHLINRFGHSEPLVRIDGFEAPKKVKAPAPKKAKKQAVKEVSS